MVTIFYNEKPLYLCDTQSALSLLKDTEKKISSKEIQSSYDIDDFFKIIFTNESEAGLLFNEDFETVISLFFNHFTIIEAAGGVVMNNSNELLFIYRRNKWDLPKGKLEMGETIEQCAQREIEEETGIHNLLFQKEINKTYHIYEENKLQILKISHWFFYKTATIDEGTPQQEEDITEIGWFPLHGLSHPLSNTYTNIQIVIEKLLAFI